jgi:hypothetical protein
VQEWPVDQLDMDAAVLHGLDGAGDLHQLAGGGFRIGEGTERDVLHFCPASNFLAASNRCIFRIIAFVHRTDLQDSCVQREEGWIDVRPKILYSAQRVSYELGQGGKGPKATLVELISR